MIKRLVLLLGWLSVVMLISWVITLVRVDEHDVKSKGIDGYVATSQIKDEALYYNGIKHMDLRQLNTEESYNYLVLVDRYNRLPEDFSPSDLTLVTGWDSNRFKNTTIFLRETAARHLERMLLAAAKECDFEMILLRSGYRSYEEQQVIFEHRVNLLGLDEAERFSARPGHSEHQTGLAVDLTTRSVNGDLVQEFGETPQGIWLRDNAHRFGFIMSNQKDREEVTGRVYEPWHFRFVGIDEATYIFENDLSLADYITQ